MGIRIVLASLWLVVGSFALAQSSLYVPGGGANDTTAIVDPSSFSIVADLSSGSRAVGMVATPGGSRAYFADVIDKSLNVVDVATDSQVATIPMPGNPWSVVLNFDATRAYVPIQDFLVVVDTNTNTIIKQIAIPSGVASLAASKAQPRLYVGGSSGFWVIDTNTNSIISSVFENQVVMAIALSSDESRAYLATRDDPNDYAAYMATVDLAAGIVIDSVPVGNDPFGIAVAPDDSRVYVSIFGRPRGSGGALVVVDVVADLVTAVIPLGGYAGPVAISPNGPTIFVAASTPLAYVIDAINLADNSISEQLTLLGGPTNDLKFITARPVVSYEAENPGNILSGKTSVVSCPICSGGSAVAAVAEPGSGRTGGALTFTNVAGIAAAQADLSIYYQHSAREPITASVNINGVNTVVNFPPVQAGSPPSRIVLAVPGQTVGTVRITGVQGTSSSSLTIDRLTVQ